MRRSFFVSLAILPLTACSLFSSLDDLQSAAGNPSTVGAGGSGGADQTGGDSSTGGDPAAGGDSSTGGGGAAAGGSGGAGGAPGPTNLLMNPGFESGMNGCGSGWSGGYGAIYELSSVAHSGSKSCLACADPIDTESFAVEPTNPISLPAGTYYAEAWIRAPDGYPSAGLTGIVLSIDTGGTTYFQGTQVGPDVDWVMSTHQFTLDTADEVTFQVHTFVPDGGCVLVDDVVLYAL